MLPFPIKSPTNNYKILSTKPTKPSYNELWQDSVTDELLVELKKCIVYDAEDYKTEVREVREGADGGQQVEEAKANLVTFGSVLAEGKDIKEDGKVKDNGVITSNSSSDNTHKQKDKLKEKDLAVQSAGNIKLTKLKRAVSTGISKLHKLLNLQDKIKLIAIAIEQTGYEEYKKKEYFSGKVYVDSEAKMFDLLNLKKLGIGNAFGLFDTARMNAAISLSSGEYFNKTRDFNGNLVQLGGMFIINKERDLFLYKFREDYAGDTPLVIELLECIGYSDFNWDSALKLCDSSLSKDELRVLHLAKSVGDEWEKLDELKLEVKLQDIEEEKEDGLQETGNDVLVESDDTDDDLVFVD